MYTLLYFLLKQSYKVLVHMDEVLQMRPCAHSPLGNARVLLRTLRLPRSSISHNHHILSKKFVSFSSTSFLIQLRIKKRAKCSQYNKYSINQDLDQPQKLNLIPAYSSKIPNTLAPQSLRHYLWYKLPSGNTA